MKYILIPAFFVITLQVAAQTDTGVRVIKDPRIDLLVKKQIQINEETTRDTRRTAQGFRIQVINTNDRTQALAAKTKVYQQYPELKAYLLYQAPYFRLRVGNFKTKQEADAYQKKLTKHFPPTNLIIVRDMIEIKPEKFIDEG
jgi:SPOR domain